MMETEPNMLIQMIPVALMIGTAILAVWGYRDYERQCGRALPSWRAMFFMWLRERREIRRKKKAQRLRRENGRVRRHRVV